MKNYTTKLGEDLGSIASKFSLPSWKYLFEINKDIIGDNPDLLKSGTVIKIPVSESSSGIEKLKAKGIDAQKLTNGLGYRYPWAPISYTLTDSNCNEVSDFNEPRELVVRSRKTGEIIHKSTIKLHDEIEMLVPGGIEHVHLGVKGIPLRIHGLMHYHPDDDPNVNTESDNA